MRMKAGAPKKATPGSAAHACLAVLIANWTTVSRHSSVSGNAALPDLRSFLLEPFLCGLVLAIFLTKCEDGSSLVDGQTPHTDKAVIFGQVHKDELVKIEAIQINVERGYASIFDLVSLADAICGIGTWLV